MGFANARASRGGIRYCSGRCSSTRRGVPARRSTPRRTPRSTRPYDARYGGVREYTNTARAVKYTFLLTQTHVCYLYFLMKIITKRACTQMRVCHLYFSFLMKIIPKRDPPCIQHPRQGPAVPHDAGLGLGPRRGLERGEQPRDRVARLAGWARQAARASNKRVVILVRNERA